MGHLRLAGQLPRYANWRRVVESLEDPASDVAAVAAVTADAAKKQLEQSADSPSVWYPYWLLIQLAAHAHEPGVFYSFLRRQDLDPDHLRSSVEFLSELDRSLQERRSEFPSRTALDELALDAFHEAASSIVLSGSDSLFDTVLEDVRHAFARVAPSRAFGRLSRYFLGSYYAKILSYFLSYELGNQVGDRGRFESFDDAEEFDRLLDRYVKQVSVLVEDFSQGWYSKKNWEQGEINQEDVRHFLHVAFRKFRQQLELEAE